jgi:hypothetical protein
VTGAERVLDAVPDRLLELLASFPGRVARAA